MERRNFLKLLGISAAVPVVDKLARKLPEDGLDKEFKEKEDVGIFPDGSPVVCSTMCYYPESSSGVMHLKGCKCDYCKHHRKYGTKGDYTWRESWE